MRFSTLTLLASLVATVHAGTTIKRTVLLPAKTSLAGLCKAWRAECLKEAAALNEGFLFRCKEVSATTATVTCVSKDFTDKTVPELQLTDSVIKALKLSYAGGAPVTKGANIPSSSPATTTTISSKAAAPTEVNATVKRTVWIPQGWSLGHLKKTWKSACSTAASTLYDESYLFRVAGSGASYASVTCVSKDFTDKSKPEEQLTDYLIEELGLVVKK